MRLKFALSLVLTLVLNFASTGQDRPKLVIGIVVDQMRYDYLERFKEGFGEKGFNRLLEGGVNCDSVYYHYKPTYTGPGHASIFTGTGPAKHGIVGNAWYDRNSASFVYCVSEKVDSTIQFGPFRLQSETLAEIMKAELNSKVYGIALKDRGAILPVGKTADGAFWYSGKSGEWESSSYYKNASLKCLKKFSPSFIKDKYLVGSWTYSGKRVFGKNTSDESKYEGNLTKNTTNYFPYKYAQAFEDAGFDLLKQIPNGNQMTIDFAQELILEEQLGMASRTDFLSISFSATDYIGHRFGIESHELEDAYLKLDKSLEGFFSFLDKTIGENEYMVFLTSDHGASPNPMLAREQKGEGGFYDEDLLKNEIDSLLDNKFGPGDYLLSLINLNLYLNKELLRDKDIDEEQIAQLISKWVESKPGIAAAVTPRSNHANVFYQKMVNASYYPKNSGDLVLIEDRCYLEGPRKGTSHGSLYDYDTHVPLLIYGGGLQQGRVSRKYTIAAIVPSICRILEISNPNKADNQLIEEIFK